MGLVFKWLKNLGNGNLNGISKINIEKSELLYNAIDNSNGFYYCPVNKEYRSKMNIRYNILDSNGNKNEKYEKEFITEATKLGLLNLKGYRTLGGIRASCYNAMTLENVKKLVKFMNDFKNSKLNKYQSKL